MSSLADMVRPYLPLLGPEDDLDGDSDLLALGADSLELIGLIFTCESLYGVQFSEEDLIPETFLTLGSLHAALRLLGARVAD
jgi:acyl carrier protein